LHQINRVDHVFDFSKAEQQGHLSAAPDPGEETGDRGSRLLFAAERWGEHTAPSGSVAADSIPAWSFSARAAGDSRVLAAMLHVIEGVVSNIEGSERRYGCEIDKPNPSS